MSSAPIPPPPTSPHFAAKFRPATLERLALLYGRIALGAAFLSGIADRFGLYTGRNVGYGNFAGFERYTAQVNSFMPTSSIPFLAWAATAAELFFGVALILGFWLRWVALGSALLLVLFGTAMAISFGIKSPLDYSVFSASAAAVMLAGLALVLAAGLGARPDDRAEILKVREQVWRAWFANDRKTLEKLVPPDTIVISSGESHWKNQAEVFEGAAKFQADGGKLTRLEFPRTEMQLYGDVAIIYSQYIVETEMAGKRSTDSGRVTEIFVRRNGQWMNSGWHTDTEK